MTEDAIYRGSVDPLGPLVRRCELVRVGRARGLILGGALLAGGVGVMLTFDIVTGVEAAISGIGIGGFELFRRRHRGAVALHTAGLRLQLAGETLMRWDDVLALRFGYTADLAEAMRPGGLVIDTVDGKTHVLPRELGGLDVIAEAIERATTARLRALLEAAIDGPGLVFGGSMLTADGFVTPYRTYPWSALSARRHHACFIIGTSTGPFEISILERPNPAPLIEIINARAKAAAGENKA